MFLKRFIGTRAFYRVLLATLVPILIQNGISNFSNLLDNIMVGTLGTEQMSGVSIVNQLIFVFNLTIFGALSGAGLFGSQLHGKGDTEGVRHIFRFKLCISLAIAVGAILLFLFGGEWLISLYLHEGSETGDLTLTLSYAKQYLSIAIFGLLPYTVSQVYASTLREIGVTVPPMTAGLCGVALNLILNTLLIFGLCGFPRMGVEGAALATVIARFFECAWVVFYTHTHPLRAPFIKGAYRSLRVPLALAKRVSVTGLPLLINEALWAAGQAMLLQCYSQRGIAAVSAMNISNTVFNTFSVVYMSVGVAVSILLGHRLGAGDSDRARTEARQMIAFAGTLGLCVGAVIVLLAPLFPQLYNTTAEVRTLATSLTVIIGLYAPFHGILNSSYFTIRSGGKTFITFLFDSGFVWGVNIPVTLALVTFTALSPAAIFLVCHATELIKLVIGVLLVRSGTWCRNITEQGETEKIEA